MSYELIMEYYQQVQEIFSNNYFQEYGIIGLFLNSLLSATAIPIPTEILTSALLIGGENIFLVALALVIGSVIGGILNYFIGFGGNKLFKKIKKESDIEKNEKPNSGKSLDQEEKNFSQKYGQVTEGLKKRLHDFWYGWVWVD